MFNYFWKNFIEIHSWTLIITKGKLPPTFCYVTTRKSKKLMSLFERTINWKIFEKKKKLNDYTFSWLNFHFLVFFFSSHMLNYFGYLKIFSKYAWLISRYNNERETCIRYAMPTFYDLPTPKNFNKKFVPTLTFIVIWVNLWKLEWWYSSTITCVN